MKTYKFKINGNGYNVVINSVSGNIADVNVNGTAYQVELEEETVAPSQTNVTPVSPTSATPVQNAPAPKPSGAGKAVQAPLPGVIIALKVNVGDSIKAGQVVAVLEAMKMENEIQAEFDGTVTAVNVAKGDSVLEGAPIVTIG